jgi:hypothetical protein
MRESMLCCGLGSRPEHHGHQESDGGCDARKVHWAGGSHETPRTSNHIVPRLILASIVTLDPKNRLRGAVS